MRQVEKRAVRDVKEKLRESGKIHSKAESSKKKRTRRKIEGF